MLSLDLGGGGQLRSLEPWQADEFFEHMDRNREYLKQFITIAHLTSTVDDARKVLQHWADARAQDKGQIFGIWLDDVLSGGTVFRAFDAPSGTCELGVWLAPEAQSRGLMSTAVRHMIDWAIRVRGFSRVEWLAVVGNAASVTLAKRAGMTFEGVRRSDFVLGGVRYDSDVYSITAADYHSSSLQR